MNEDTITPAAAQTLYGLFRERARRTPDKIAYRQFDKTSDQWCDYTWAETADEVARWRRELAAEDLKAGDRVAVMLRNCREWVIFDQAALGLGLVVVPLYLNDRAENVAFILNDAGVNLLLLGDETQWHQVAPIRNKLSSVRRIVTLDPVAGPTDSRLRNADDWLQGSQKHDAEPTISNDPLASIVYTSGTTGRPKGVMLSHSNILENTWSIHEHIPEAGSTELFLSFLPLSHTFERTCGYYLPMMLGATVAYARSIEELAEDLASQKPTVLISVPRIYERIHTRLHSALESRPAVAKWLFRTAVEVGWRVFEHSQGRGRWQWSQLLWPLLKFLVARPVSARLGGRLRFAISGGAPLNPDVARLFIGLGLRVLQGYGLTESSPVISANTPSDNLPHSVGHALPGLEVRVGEEDELLVRGPSVMLGYWNQPKATAEVLDSDGWLHTGDKARIEDERIIITGRLKEIIVLANGEKIAPADMEMAIGTDRLIHEQQVIVLGDARPYLSALVVLNQEMWVAVAREKGFPEDLQQVLHDKRVEQMVLERLSERLSRFPGYAQLRRLAILTEAWTVENALLTPTLKPRRERIVEQYRPLIDQLYEGHSSYTPLAEDTVAES